MHGGRPLPNQILDHTYHPNPRTSHAKLIRRFGGTIPRFTLSQKEGGNTSRYSVVLTGYCTTGLGNGGEANEAAIKCKGGYFGLEQPTKPSASTSPRRPLRLLYVTQREKKGKVSIAPTRRIATRGEALSSSPACCLKPRWWSIPVCSTVLRTISHYILFLPLFNLLPRSALHSTTRIASSLVHDPFKFLLASAGLV